ncbi:hypothetical protein SLT36_30035 (plasmid) [Aminobacter sp. BA135]|uniref:hypothetical protein n=1 Tax=Aminobacter sp. BA135 TaxID=537596 RepID=UPI003D7C0014
MRNADRQGKQHSCSSETGFDIARAQFRFRGDLAVRWEFRAFREIREGTVFSVYALPQDKSSPPPALTIGDSVWIDNDDHRIPAKVLKADQSEILLASDDLQTLHLLPASNSHRHFGLVGPGMYSEDWQVEQLLPPAR